MIGEKDISKVKRPWIVEGYEIFCKEGPNELKVEVLSNIVGKSKSSFYHLFGDLDLFINSLLDYHLSQIEIVAAKEAVAKSVDPELIQILIDHKKEVLFNKQLRIHREVTTFKKCYEKSDLIIGDGFVKVWARDLGLKDHTIIAKSVYDFALDNFYLQVTEETLTHKWLLDYFLQLRSMVSTLKNQ